MIRPLPKMIGYRDQLKNSVRYRRVLFVCKANVSRSIMAEAIFNMFTQSAHLQASRLCARSAGIDINWSGKAANSEAQKLMLEMGLDISQHRGKYIDQGLVDWADVILTMEQQQKYYMMGLFPHSADKVFLISELAGEEGEVPDPYQQGTKAYRQCLSQLSRFINIILENMKPPRFTDKSGEV